MRTTTFGIELEFDPRNYTHLDRTWNEVERYVCSITGQNNLPSYSSATKWAMHHEQSGLELTTPALNWRTWPRAKRIIKAIAEMRNVHTTLENGTHVHFGVRGMKQKHLQNLLKFWAAFEPVILRLVRSDRRNNDYCNPLGSQVINYFQRNEDLKKARELFPSLRNILDVDSRDSYSYYDDDQLGILCDKFNTLNVSEAFDHLDGMSTRRRYTGTLEVRLHHGTLNADELEGWITLMQRTLNLGMNNTEKLKPVRPNTAGFSKYISILDDAECREIVRTRRRQFAS